MSKPGHDEVAGIAQILAGGTASLIALAMLVFGEPTEPGEYQSALFAALEQMMGYYTMCSVFLAIGLAMLAYGLWVWRRAKSSEAIRTP